MSYVSEQLEKLKAKNANEPEFIQAATEVLTSLEPVFEQNPKYEPWLPCSVQQCYWTLQGWFKTSSVSKPRRY